MSIYKVLGKHDKEQLVIKLNREGKTLRDIASAAHMSFSDIKKIIQRVNGEVNGIDLSNKSKSTQALYLFKNGKKPIEVVIELDLPESEVYDLHQEFWALNQLYDLPLVYYELKHDLNSFIELFQAMKKNKLINRKDIQTVLRHSAFDLPSLENRIQRLSSDAIDLEWKKKQLVDEVVKLNSYLSQLKKLQKQYHMEIGLKKEIISNLDQQLNQKSEALQEKITRNSA